MSARSPVLRCSRALAARRSSFALGLLLSLPLLHGLYRRFHSYVAPALAVAAFAAVFTFSSLVIAPRLTGSEKAPATPVVGQPQQDGHAGPHEAGNR